MRTAPWRDCISVPVSFTFQRPRASQTHDLSSAWRFAIELWPFWCLASWFLSTPSSSLLLWLAPSHTRPGSKLEDQTLKKSWWQVWGTRRRSRGADSRLGVCENFKGPPQCPFKETRGLVLTRASMDRTKWQSTLSRWSVQARVPFSLCLDQMNHPHDISCPLYSSRDPPRTKLSQLQQNQKWTQKWVSALQLSLVKRELILQSAGFFLEAKCYV